MQGKFKIDWFRVGVLAGVVVICVAAWVGVCTTFVVALEHLGIVAPRP